MEAPRYGLGTLRLFLYLDCSCTLRQAQGDASTSSATACGALYLDKLGNRAAYGSKEAVAELVEVQGKPYLILVT